MEEENDEFVLYESYNSEINKLVIIDNDEHSIWAFLMDSETQEIEFDGFVCALTAPFENEDAVEKIIEEGGAPAITQEFASEFALQANALEKEFTTEWGDDGYLFIYMDGELVVVMDLEDQVSFSKSVKQDGPYGLALTEEVLEELGLGAEQEDLGEEE